MKFVKETILNDIKLNALLSIDKEDIKNGVLRIPEGVQMIKENACQNFLDIKKVIIPATVQIISDYAFYDNRFLKEVVFEGESELVIIGAHAFEKNISLEKISLPKNVKYLSEKTFAVTGLKEIELNEGLKHLGKSCFSGTKFLEKIVIPSTLEVIPERCFFMSGLMTLECKEGLKEIKESAFASCPTLYNVSLPQSLKKIYGRAFADSNINAIEIYKTTKCNKNAFENCEIPYTFERTPRKIEDEENE